MRFTSWNVNGFRAVVKKGFMEWLAADRSDVLSLQEIRCSWTDVDPDTRASIEADYDVSWFPATSKKGYAGAATLVRKGLGFTHTQGLGIAEYDAEGRIIVSTRDRLDLVAGYFPNAGEGLARLPFKRAFARDLASAVEARHALGHEVILVGDMNVAPCEIDLARPKDNTKNPGFTPEEREDFRRYLGAGLVDILRERNPGVPGLYTWWSQRLGARPRNVGWRIDLFLISASLRDRVHGVGISADVMGSDHCPIWLELD